MSLKQKQPGTWSKVGEATGTSFISFFREFRDLIKWFIVYKKSKSDEKPNDNSNMDDDDPIQ